MMARSNNPAVEWNNFIVIEFHTVLTNQNKPLDAGATICIVAEAAPDPWPIKVTCLGSPPKRPMLVWTHRSAMFWSHSPKLPGASAVSNERKPFGDGKRQGCPHLRHQIKHHSAVEFTKDVEAIMNRHNNESFSGQIFSWILSWIARREHFTFQEHDDRIRLEFDGNLMKDTKSTWANCYRLFRFSVLRSYNVVLAHSSQTKAVNLRLFGQYLAWFQIISKRR